MKNLTIARILLCVLLLFAFAASLSAAHIIGGEITYECLGYTNGDSTSNSRTYVFTMRIYRDCAGGGADFDGPQGFFDCLVTIYHGNQVLDPAGINLGAPTITLLEPNLGNPCLITPPSVCVQEGVYVFPPIDLPISDKSYSVIYQRCCRNNTITNIWMPESTGATYSIELTPEAQTSCNNSPTFNEFPPIVLCAGEYFSFDGSATDVDGDQLVYELCTPFMGGGNQGNFEDFDGLAPQPESPPSSFAGVNFKAPYSAFNPVGAESAFSYNVVTGQLQGTPQFSGQFVVGICVSEFRDGKLLSKVRRDFQFNITAECENLVNAAIQADEVINGDEFAVLSCGDRQVNILNLSQDASFIDVYRWEVFVEGDTVRGNERDFSYEFPSPGIYSGRMIINPDVLGCNDTAFIKIAISDGISADFSFAYDTCRADPVVFTNLSVAAGGVDFHRWQFGDNLAANIPDPQHLYIEPGLYPVELLVSDPFGCRDSLVRNVSYFPVPNLIIISPDDSRICVPDEVFFDNLSSPIDDTYQIAWDFGDGGRDTAISPTHAFTQPGTFSVGVEITSPIGCVTDTSFTNLIIVDPRPIADFSYSPDPVDYFNRGVSFQDESTGAYRWYWKMADQATSILRDPVFVLPDSGLVAITQVVTHPTGCIDSLVRFVDVVPLITYNMPNAFTPNGDGLNDVFLGKGFLRGYRSFDFQIWNRWGDMFFTSDDPARGWDGRVRGGSDAAPGVYLYQVQLVGPRGEPLHKKGTVTLVR